MTESRASRQTSDQRDAIALLRQAREILTERLTQSLLELGEDLLDDARGDSFCGEIDSLHERLGIRLNQINALLAGLNTSDEPDERQAPQRSTPQKRVRKDTPDSSDPHELMPHSLRSVPRTFGTETPATHPASTDALTTRTSISTYPLFVQDIVRRDLPAAGRRLAEVLGTSPSQGEAYSVRFRDQLDRDPGFLAKVHCLRQALQADNETDAGALLQECFGMSPEHARSSMTLLRGWL